MKKLRIGKTKLVRIFSYATWIFTIVAWPIWAKIVLGSVGGWHSIINQNDGSASNEAGSAIARFGQFGDSFGAIASLMATLAAAVAIFAFVEQQKERGIQEFERNFFTMLENLQKIVDGIDVHRRDNSNLLKSTQRINDKQERRLYYLYHRPFQEVRGYVEGKDALRALLADLRYKIRTADTFNDSKSINIVWEDFYDRWADDLGQYFRTCYHIFRMIDERAPAGKKKYARMARAQLSNSEIILLSYNCSVGIGRYKFRKYFVDFEISHNYHVDRRGDFFESEFFFFKRMFPECSFERDEFRPYTYNEGPSFIAAA